MSDLVRVIDSEGDLVVADIVEGTIDGQEFVRIRVVDTGESGDGDEEVAVTEVWLDPETVLAVADAIRPVEPVEKPTSSSFPAWRPVEWRELLPEDRARVYRTGDVPDNAEIFTVGSIGTDGYLYDVRGGSRFGDFYGYRNHIIEVLR